MKDKKTILVIDDEEDLREMVQYQFEARGYNVETAEDGIAGLEKLKTCNPDLIILDMNMPRMGGIEFYNNICTSDGKPSHSVFVLTARANMEQLFKDFNVDGFMAKPFEIDKLIREVDEIIKKKASMGFEEDVFKFNELKTICIVEDDMKLQSELALIFLKKDFCVYTAKAGIEAVEKITNNPPNFALIKLGLKDMPGDLIILKLRQMVKTKHVRVVLFSNDSNANLAISEIMESKSGVTKYVETANPEILLETIKSLC